MAKIKQEHILINIEERYSSNFTLLATGVELEPGIITGVFGRNGSGKTSFLRSLSRYKLDYEKENKFSFIETIPKEWSHLSCGCILSFLNTKFNNLTIDKSLMNACGIKEIQKKKVKELSTGQYQRLINFINLLKRDKIVLLDEPFNGLDSEFKSKLIAYLKNESISVVLVAHQVDILKTICEKFLLVESGEVKEISEKESFGFCNEESYIFKFKEKLSCSNLLEYLGFEDDLYQYRALNLIEGIDINKISEVLKRYPKEFVEMKKVDGDLSFKGEH
tara:strand:- start:1045 stop:1875 length:831 start_codon:yes stop_codon:yes gene_type:complete